MGLLRRRPSPAMVVALLALFVAMGGSSYAALKIGTRNLKNSSVTSAKIKNGTVVSKDISRRTRQTLKGQKGDPGEKGVKGDQGSAGSPGSPGASMLTGATPGSGGSGSGFSTFAPSGVSFGTRQLSPSVTVIASDLAAQVSNPPGVGGTATIVLYVNEVSTPLACTVSATSSTCVSGATTTIAPGSTLHIRVFVTSSNDLGTVRWGFRTLAT
jgi:hypothetical protein